MKGDRAKIATATGHAFLPRRHIQLLADVKKRPGAENELVDIDWVGFAERFINAPYKWEDVRLGA